MELGKDPKKLWDQYEKVKSYKTAIGLYEQVKTNQNFYLDKQWEGLNAPDIDKPVINVIRPSVDYYASMLVSDDIGIQCQFPEDTPDEVKQAVEYVIDKEIEEVFEHTKFKHKTRAFIKACAVNADAFFYWRYNSTKQTKKDVVGAIDLEMLANTNVGFGDPTEHEVQKQPWILVVQKVPTDKLKEIAKENGVANWEEIKEDDEEYNQMETEARVHAKYTTLLTFFYKVQGIVHAKQSTSTHIIRDEIDLGVKLYPIAYMSFRQQQDSYHGVSPVTGVIQNQIMINKFYMMIAEFVRKMAFPKMFYDMTVIPRWSNKVEAIGVNGDPTKAFMATTPVMNMSSQVMEYVQDLIAKTKEAMGVYDVALGNARPDNTSAIIALQKSASQPLELQKFDYYQVVEDSVRIIMDLMAVNYGIRDITIKMPMDPQMQQMMMLSGQPVDDALVAVPLPFDYSQIAPDQLSIIVEVGASAYWTEIMNIQSLDNMYRAGIIPDPITYLEQLPNGIVKSKADIIEAIKKKEMQMQAMQQMQMELAMQQPQGAPANVGSANGLQTR